MLDTGRLPLIGDALAYFRQALDCAASGEHEKAVAFYNQVLQTRSDFWEAWYERGLSLESLGFYSEAIASYDRAIQARPNREAEVEIWHDRGNAMQYGLGDCETALTCYNHALQINDTCPLVWLNRGNALLYGLSQYHDAIASYNRAIELYPDNYLTWRNRGNALVELKRYSEAIASYDRALSLQADDQVSWQARLLASQQCGLSALKQPTTNPVWQGEDSHNPTLVEGERAHPSEVESIEVDATVTYRSPVLVLEDDAGQREIVLEDERYTIGRDPKNDICLRSQFASRFHAVLHRVDGQNYAIVDGNIEGKPSTNGLLINGQRQRSHPLKTGDLIIFGPYVRATYQAPTLNL
ncbi:MAG: tetratricopeptide repeat protein [Leptolyngbyaceae cyanobacterium CSU_1_3]|nr:tetratricopeptide repeat protein [Leptolyngbyaceae cyanobacterium CSU_1_3]